MIKKITAYLLLILIGAGIANAQPAGSTYLIPIKGEINSALVTYVDNALKEAEAANASQVIFEIDTNGGLVDSALKISKRITGTSLPTVCYIEDNAISAGVIISISGDKVVANKTINIGSAETRPKEEKYISYWAGELREVAELKGRDPKIMAAMADADIEIEGITKKGKLINFTASQALEHGVVDKIVDGREQLYDYLNISENQVVAFEYDFKTNIARFTNSVSVSTMLITFGIIGIIGEILTAGFGLFGTIGILSFALFFAGKVLGGHAGWGVLILFVAGLVLLLIEIGIPGFGIPGIAGIACIVLSILLSSSNPLQAAGSFSAALMISVIVLAVMLKFLPRNKFFDHIILKSDMVNTVNDEKSASNKSNLVGMEGIALTFLRPAGSVQIGENRIDVVSEGEYIEKGTKVKVIYVQGNRIVVRKI
ncbi:NfeD family protein [Petroclostridium sp. X23]|uniref:NfeD family protein n=1 Tax=Petroclostridium sp. X23 TaxID=3045146 RepID=UPI0024AD7FC5|nr:NfeD family protein [Petroclostridium sp. X23]WHH59924.1 NfeD family protein [Petroclostridium sp. X23]